MKQQNISNFKLECSKDLLMKFGEYRSNFTLKPFLSIRSRGRVAKTPPLSPPLSKDEKLREIGHSMRIGNLIFLQPQMPEMQVLKVLNFPKAL